MNKDQIRNWAVELLKGIDTEEVESIEISGDEYEDGTPYLNISIVYKSKGGEQ